MYTGSMAEATAYGYVVNVRKMFVDLGYVKKVGRGRGDYSVLSGENWRKLSVPQIQEYVRGKFPPGSRMTPNVKKQRFQLGLGIKKFAEFMVFSQHLWSEDKLFEVRKVCSFATVDYEEIVIEPPHKSHAFVDWLLEKDMAMGFPLFLEQWLGGMRYSEVSGANVDLKTGTLNLNLTTKVAGITGKGAEGKTRYAPFDNLVVRKLKKYLKWRATLDVEFDTLCVKAKYIGTGKTGDRKFLGWEPLWPKAGKFNDRLKPLVDEYNLAMKEAGKKDMVMDPELCTTHKLGRHVFGTNFGKTIPGKQLKKAMGIVSEAVLEKYQNYTWDDRHEAYSGVTATYLNGGGKPRPVSDVTVALDGIRQFAPKGKEVPWNSLVDGLIGLVT